MRMIIIMAVLVLTGCATPPLTYDFSPESSYKSSKDIVWAGVMSFFSEGNIQIKTLEKDSGVVYAENTYTSANSSLIDQFADCGKYPAMTPIGGLAGFNIFVSQSPKKENVTVRVNTNFKKSWFFSSALVGNITESIVCNSRGTLEKTILDHIHAYVDLHQ